MEKFKSVRKKTKAEWAKFHRETKKAQKDLELSKQEDPEDYKEQMKLQKTMGKRVKEYRTKAKMSIEELSERADLPLDYLQAIEEGKISTYVSDTFSIGYVLQVEPYKFYK